MRFPLVVELKLFQVAISDRCCSLLAIVIPSIPFPSHLLLRFSSFAWQVSFSITNNSASLRMARVSHKEGIRVAEQHK